MRRARCDVDVAPRGTRRRARRDGDGVHARARDAGANVAPVARDAREADGADVNARDEGADDARVDIDIDIDIDVVVVVERCVHAPCVVHGTRRRAR